VLIYLLCFGLLIYKFMCIHMGFLSCFFFHTHLQRQPTICNMASRFYKQIPPQGGDTTKTTPGPGTPGYSQLRVWWKWESGRHYFFTYSVTETQEVRAEIKKAEQANSCGRRGSSSAHLNYTEKV
jgi:hypothetical protein